jgi:hypothetical protein
MVKKLDISLSTGLQTDLLNPVCYSIIELTDKIKTWDQLRSHIMRGFTDGIFYNVDTLTQRNQERMYIEIQKQVRKDRARNHCFPNTPIIFLTAIEVK